MPLHTLVPKYAKGFVIDYFKEYVKITLFDLEKETDTLGVFLFPLEKPLRLACQSTTHVNYIDTLQQSHQIVACAYADRLKKIQLADRVKNNTLLNISGGDEINKELLWSSKADVFFVYPFDKSIEAKVKHKALTVIPISEYLEKHPLGRAEWLLLFGALVQKEKEADALFRSIERKYTETVSATPLHQRPAVFLGSREGSSWFAAPANSYLAQLVNDAGGKYLLNDRTAPGNLLLNDEELTAMCWNIPFFGMIAYSNERISRTWMADQAPSLRQSPTFQKEQLFFCNAIESDFFGKALIEPHILLRDLRSLFEASSNASTPSVYFHKTP